MIELHYEYSDFNSDFIGEIIRYIDNCITDIYWVVSDLDIIVNDREDYINNKTLFSEKVLMFQEKVDREFGVYVSTEKFLDILFNSRTVYRGAIACFKNNIPKLRQYIPFTEGNIDKIKSSHALLEIRVIDGDLIFLIGNDGVNLDFVKEKFNKYLSRVY